MVAEFAKKNVLDAVQSDLDSDVRRAMATATDAAASASVVEAKIDSLASQMQSGERASVTRHPFLCKNAHCAYSTRLTGEGCLDTAVADGLHTSHRSVIGYIDTQLAKARSNQEEHAAAMDSFRALYDKAHGLHQSTNAMTERWGQDNIVLEGRIQTKIEDLEARIRFLADPQGFLESLSPWRTLTVGGGPPTAVDATGVALAMEVVLERLAKLEEQRAAAGQVSLAEPGYLTERASRGTAALR